MITTDVMIIGGGLAGFCAAAEAARAGREVLLCAGPSGASSMHSGVFDTDANPSRINNISIPDVSSAGRNLELISVAAPRHPYSVLGGRNSEASLRESIELFREFISGGGFEIHGDMHDRMTLISAMGTVRRARLAVDSIAAGAVRNPDEMKVLFVGISGMPSFNSRFVASAANSSVERATGKTFAEISHVEVELPGCDGFNNISSMQAAEALDDSSVAEKFAAGVAAAAGGGFTHAYFPAVIGLAQSSTVIRNLEEKLGCVVAELATAPPSVPAARLSIAMDAALSSMNVKVMRGTAAGYFSEDGLVRSVDVETKHDGIVTVEAQSFALATGRFIGGGLMHDERLVETVFGLPVFVNEKVYDKEDFPMKFLAADIGARQPLFEAGLKVDSELFPLDADGERVYENLFCAGSIIGGYDAQRDGCGSGVAILTGSKAGRAAAGFKAGSD